MKREVSILIPIYNEERSISGTINTIVELMNKTNIEFEIIAINDGSKDNSLEVLQLIPNISIISHKVNKGYGASLKTGLRHAAFDNICITDADGTYPNDRIPDMFELMYDDKLDMIVGSRNGTNVSYPLIKKIPKYFIQKFSNYISNTKIPDINSGLRIFNKGIALKFFHLYPNGFSFTTTITMSMICADYEVEYTPIDYFKREGKSKIKPFKDTIGFFKLLLRIALYFNPFKFFTPIIILFLLASLGVLYRDIYILKNLTQTGLFFPVFTFLFFTLGLLADMIIKRTS